MSCSLPKSPPQRRLTALLPSQLPPDSVPTCMGRGFSKQNSASGEESQPALQRGSSRCLLLALPSMALVQRRLKSDGGKHRSCRGNRPFLAEQPPCCWAAGRAVQGCAVALQPPPTPLHPAKLLAPYP